MIVDVRTTATAWDSSLQLLGEQIERRLPAARSALAQTSATTDDLTVRISALGLADAYRGREDETSTKLVVPIWLHGATALVGPRWAGAAGTGPCPVCVERRWQAIRVREERQCLENGTKVAVTGALPHVTPFAVEALWQLTLKAVAQEQTRSGIGRLCQLRMDTLDTTVTEVMADSECPTCATPVADAEQHALITLRRRIKPSPTSYRLRAADELDLPVSALANPAVGALGANPIRAYNATATAPVSGFFRVRSRYDLHEMWWSGHANNYGASETYALLEGLERYAGQFPRAKRTTVFDSYDNLKPRALDPAGLGYHPAFYTGHGMHYTQYSPSEPLHWVWGYSLRDREPRLVPEQIVYYLDRRSEQQKFVQECSSGCASGSCPEEALLHGMLELIERDAFLLAWYGKSRLAEIDPATVRDKRVQFLLDRVNLLGYDIRLFDTRADLPVPVVTAVAVRRDGGLGQLCFAAGASLDPDDAVRAAVCETASYVPEFDERVAAKEPDLRLMVEDYTRVHELSQHALLYGLPEMTQHAAFLFDDPPMRPMDELYADWLAIRPGSTDLSADVEFLVDVLAKLDGDIVAVDQTCPEQQIAGIHTMAMVAPALIPIDFGWQRQRVLYSDRLQRHLDRGQQGPDRLGATGRNLNPHPFP